MLDKDAIRRLLDYTVWANHRAMRAAATLSAEDFRKDLGASHGGIRGTFAHMMSAEWVWLERWKGVARPRMLDEAEFDDIVSLRDRWTVIEQHREVWLESLPIEEIQKTLHYSNLQGEAFQGPLWELVQHVANHSTYHRGQVTLLLRQLGARVLATDMVIWDRKQAAAK